MKDKSLWFFKNVHLLISLSIVVPTAIIYGSPSVLPQHLDIQVNTNDLANMLKAIMFLYLGVSIVWVLGICKPKYWKSATQLNMLFMLTLAFGRLLSMLVDGMPTGGYIFGVLAELIIGFYAAFQLKNMETEG